MFSSESCIWEPFPIIQTSSFPFTSADYDRWSYRKSGIQKPVLVFHGTAVDLCHTESHHLGVMLGGPSCSEVCFILLTLMGVFQVSI